MIIMTKVPFTPTVYVTLSGRLYRLVEKTKQSCENLVFLSKLLESQGG